MVNTPLLSLFPCAPPLKRGTGFAGDDTRPDYAKPLVGPLCAARKEGKTHSFYYPFRISICLKFLLKLNSRFLFLSMEYSVISLPSATIL